MQQDKNDLVIDLCRLALALISPRIFLKLISGIVSKLLNNCKPTLTIPLFKFYNFSKELKSIFKES